MSHGSDAGVPPTRTVPDEQVADLTHDVRNAAASITSALQILRFQNAGRRAVEQARRTIERQSEQLIRLARRLQNLARTDFEDRPEVDEHPRMPGSCRILVVDDSHDAANSLAVLLKLWGHDVRVCYDGPSAVAAALEAPPDVCLLDIWMPEMNGYQVAERLRRDARLEGTLLVAMTGFAQEWDRPLAAEAGFDYRLVKPVEVATLRELLGRVKRQSA